jgi:hypothetical protein
VKKSVDDLENLKHVEPRYVILKYMDTALIIIRISMITSEERGNVQ